MKMTARKTVFGYGQILYSQDEKSKPYQLGARSSHSIRTNPRHSLLTISCLDFTRERIAKKYDTAFCDEPGHSGCAPMAHYLIALCVGCYPASRHRA